MSTLATLGLTADKVAALLNNTQHRPSRQVHSADSSSRQMFTHDEVRQIRVERDIGAKVEWIASKWNCSIVHVSKICSGEYYAKAPGPFTGKKPRQIKVTDEVRAAILKAAKSRPKPSLRKLQRKFRMDRKRIKKILQNRPLGRSHLRKLSDDQVREIWQIAKTGLDCSAIGRKYGVNHKVVRRILARESYQDVSKYACNSKRSVES